MTPVNPDLLADLARLLKRYPPEEWNALMSWIQAPDRRRDLIAFLETMATAAKERRLANRGRPSTTSVLAKLRESDPAKAEFLIGFRERLAAGNVLHSLSDIRDFMHRLGIELEQIPKKREQAINRLTEELVDLPLDRIVEACAMIRSDVSQNDTEFSRWVDLILGRSSNRS